MKKLRITFYSVFGILIGMAIFIGLWITNPSEKYWEHVETSVDRDDSGQWAATVTRQLPHGNVWARWSLVVWVRRGEASFFCAQPESELLEYEVSNGPTIVYELPSTVTRCMDEAPPIRLTWTRQVLLWGWLPLRKFEVPVTINPSTAFYHAP